MSAVSCLSKNLHSLRRLRALSQSEFAKELGISRSTYQEIEAGSSPNLETVDCIARHLGLPVSVLVSDPLPPDQMGVLIQLFQSVSWYAQWPCRDQSQFLQLAIRLARLMERHL